jgi:threonine synthase
MIPQIALYFHAYGQLLRADKVIPGEKVNFVIPAGNLGNAVAAWYASCMGLPVERFILATNRNRALIDFVKNGRIRHSRRANHHTLTPAMDVLMPANIERLLYSLSEPATKYAEFFAAGRDFSLDARDLKEVNYRFVAGSVDDDQTLRAIRTAYDRTDYVLDPHTAAAMDVYQRYRESSGDEVKTIFVSVASPLRYVHTVGTALFGANAIKNLDENELTEKVAVEAGIENELQKWQSEEVGAVPKLAAGDMRRTILEQLGIY